MEDCRPPVYGPDERPRTYTKDSLGREWYRKHSREELEVGRSEMDQYTCLKRSKASEIRRLLTEIGRQAQQSRELFVRAQDLQDRFWGHSAFGEEVQCDYDSDNGDTLLIRNGSEYDLKISRLDYDTSRFRLQVREQMSQFPEDPLDLDLHNLIRDSSGYHRIERISILY